MIEKTSLNKGDELMENRRSGILLHVTSLPSLWGIGDLGSGAKKFIDFLYDSGQSLWQVLPLNPTDLSRGNIPYSSSSAFASNTLLISVENLVMDGLIKEKDADEWKIEEIESIDYEKVILLKAKILETVWNNFNSPSSNNKFLKDEFEKFCDLNSSWLEDFALFSALKKRFNQTPWYQWPDEIKKRNKGAISEIRVELEEICLKEKFYQFLFEKQWNSLKEYCNSKGIEIIGDIPVYVDYDSVDVWTNPHLFKLGHNLKPLFVSGVPPDYFSEEGQLWGTPVYNWDKMEEENFRWWLRRFERNFKLYDIIRLDHFRGFVAYWEIEYGKKASTGKWVKCPSEKFFNTVLSHFDKKISIIAEDLGIITDDVKAIKDMFGFPGMKVLLFAFGDDFPRSPYLPHNYEKNCVVYPGTHDNNTIMGWFEEEASEREKKNLMRYIGKDLTLEDINWEIIKLAWMSVAKYSIASMQDILGLGSCSRINTPGTLEGNYRWKLTTNQLEKAPCEELLELTETYDRKRVN